MRTFIAAGAAVLAATVGIVNAQSETIQFDQFAWNGNYSNPVIKEGALHCGHRNWTYTSGGLSPLNDEITWHFRGPIQLRKFAAYKINPQKKVRRSALHRRHGHAHLHAHDEHVEKREDVLATATFNGVVVTMTLNPDTWEDGQTAAPVAVPDVAGVGGAGSKDPTSGTVNTAPYVPTGNGQWIREAFYDADTQTRQGLNFMNLHGGEGSGVFDDVLGMSLSYASADGLSGSATPQTLEKKTFESDQEFSIMTDKPCKGDSCGTYRPGTVALHGFDTQNKVFVFEFKMPTSSTGTSYPDEPAVWGLNSLIDRVQQYGSCSCWEYGCGELDVFEVIPGNNAQLKSTFQGRQTTADAGPSTSLGANSFFLRPTSEYMVGAVIFHGSSITIKHLSDFSFADSMSSSEVHGLGGDAFVAAATEALETVDMSQVFG